MRNRSRRTRGVWIACLAIGLGVTLAVIFVPALRFSYRNPSLHVLLDTAEAMVALLVAYVMFGRYRTTHEARALALVLALGTLAISSLFFSAVAEVVAGGGSERVATWAPLGTRLIAAVAFAAGAFLPARLTVSRPRGRIISVSFAVGLGVGVGILLAIAGDLPEAIDPTIDPGASRQPLIVGHPVVLAAQVAMMVLFASSAGAFLRSAEEHGDPAYRWFGAGAVLAAFARVNYFLFPSLYTDFVYVGDALRLGFYALLLVGAAEEIRSYWRSRADAAVLEVRNELARNLHDGLAQELVFIAAQTRRLAKGGTDRDVDVLNHAADRAVAEARRAIAALSRPVDERLSDAIAETAEEETRRGGATLRLRLDDAIEVTLEQRETLVRITREAVSHAMERAGAGEITVDLAGDNGIRLTVGANATLGSDNADDPDNPGLMMMRERARSIGGRLYIENARDGRIELTVEVP